jgi:hypothetical protein
MEVFKIKNNKVELVDLNPFKLEKEIPRINKLRIMKNKLQILFTLLIITLLSCNIEQNIIGEWKRIKGGNEGIIVNVIKEKDFYVGRVTKKSDKKDILEFEVGDIKWKDIEYIEEGKYKFKDQTKGLLIILNGQEYEEGYLEFKGDTINVIHNINGGVGERQTWIRKK